ncbi:MAG TPA: hypothetical protein PL164_02095, partial [Candidatus Paceibacterota bacterium]|nr:hypothetical protein [Candidatus Paceibacterota bacterium]HOK97409.1 hypothetical protein [Candidatus Paceibacterota bacterium]HPP64904.1 hypothetical protein [Candidatus Paceibacterota bacterium]
MFIYKIKNYKIKNCFRGVASLITVISLGTLIFIVSLATSILAYYSNLNIDSNKKAIIANYAAYSGLQDALLKLERNKDYSSSFNLSVNGTNDVSVTVSGGTITSTATFSQISKKLQTVVVIDSTTGLITPTSTVELTL